MQSLSGHNVDADGRAVEQKGARVLKAVLRGAQERQEEGIRKSERAEQ